MSKRSYHFLIELSLQNYYKKNDLQVLNIGSCKSFRLEINIPPFVSTPVRYYRLTVGQKRGY